MIAGVGGLLFGWGAVWRRTGKSYSKYSVCAPKARMTANSHHG
jgi:hypothetical protein